ncbi:MAG: NADH-quinone oxidoreductase subunit L [Anaerolineales bacterium]|nr:NADH-quinone oxidoreductase subunit L [Anaerolineales bacterium]
MTTETIIWLLPLPPLLAFFLIVLFTNKRKALSHSLAVGAALLSWLGSMLVFVRALGVHEFGKEVFESTLNWLPTGDTWLKIGVLIDPLSAATLFFVAWTVLMIFIYSVGYHNYGQPRGDHDRPGLPPHGATLEDEKGHKHVVPSIEPMYSRFFAFIGLFAFGMYTLVVSNNLLTLFVGWEIMGLCSYLLIGFWYGKKSARDAAIKAFMTTRVGDVFMLLGIAFLYSATGTLSFREIFTAETLHLLATTATPFLGLSAAGLIGLLLFIGTVGKSAQWPLHVWLPDAMEGPTPVSAMIHAATMVSAGVYAALRMFPLITADFTGHGLTTTMSIIAFIGAFTAIFAATIAVAQNDIKRVLAYSTISQLGFMIAALGIGAYVAAAFHLITHAFFKALLFLGSGSVIHGIEHGALHSGEHLDANDMFNMGGLRKKMPVTFGTFLIGGFALSGFPLLTAGFWSKDEILADAFGHGHWAVFATLAIAAFLTAFYTMRQITLTFLGQPRSKAAQHAQETPWTMTLPLVILSVFAIGFGWVGIPEHFPVIGGIIPNWIHEFIGGTLAHHPKAVEFDILPLATSLGVALGGLLLGWLVYHKVKSPEQDRLQIPLLKNKYYFDEAYNFLFVRSAYWISETFTYMFMDAKVIDGLLHSLGRVALWLGGFLRNYFDKPVINEFIGDGTGNVVKKTGRNLRFIQAGRIQSYMVVSFAMIVLFVVLYYFLIGGV